MRCRFALSILASIVYLATLAACDAPPATVDVSRDAVVLAFGDSLTHGNGAPSGQSYPDILSDRLGLVVINAGVPGENTARGLQRLPQVLDKHQPDLVILCHGGNDFLQRRSRGETERNIRAMIEMVLAHNADVILVGVPEPGLFLEPPEFYQKLANYYRIPYEAKIVSDLLGDGRLKSDAIHPNAAGYRLLAAAVENLIRQSP